MRRRLKRGFMYCVYCGRVVDKARTVKGKCERCVKVQEEISNSRRAKKYQNTENIYDRLFNEEPSFDKN